MVVVIWSEDCWAHDRVSWPLKLIQNFILFCKTGALWTIPVPESVMETCSVVLTFESVDETLWCDHSNETSSAVLLQGTICFAIFTKYGFYMNFYLWHYWELKGYTRNELKAQTSLTTLSTSDDKLDFQPFEGVRFSDPPPCAKERGRTKRLEIEPTVTIDRPLSWATFTPAPFGRSLFSSQTDFNSLHHMTLWTAVCISMIYSKNGTHF